MFFVTDVADDIVDNIAEAVANINFDSFFTDVAHVADIAVTHEEQIEQIICSFQAQIFLAPGFDTFLSFFLYFFEGFY